MNSKPTEKAMNLAELNKVAEAMVAPAAAFLPPTNRPAPSRSASTRSERNPPRTIAAITASCCSARPKRCRSTFPASSSTTRPSARTPRTAPPGQGDRAAGAIPGIKVDKGTTPLPFCPGELITEGLDGLRQRLAEYRGLGASFAKWRAVIDIGPGIPSYTAIITNANALARYAALCQERTSFRSSSPRS
jgi:fructose-bisphosphate aldolase class I